MTFLSVGTFVFISCVCSITEATTCKVYRSQISKLRDLSGCRRSVDLHLLRFGEMFWVWVRSWRLNDSWLVWSLPILKLVCCKSEFKLVLLGCCLLKWWVYLVCVAAIAMEFFRSQDGHSCGTLLTLPFVESIEDFWLLPLIWVSKGDVGISFEVWPFSFLTLPLKCSLLNVRFSCCSFGLSLKKWVSISKLDS